MPIGLSATPSCPACYLLHRNWPKYQLHSVAHTVASFQCCTAAPLKAAHSTRYDWAQGLLNLFPLCPFFFADEDVAVLLLSFICSKCHKMALQSCGPYCSRTAVDAIERTRCFSSRASCFGSPIVYCDTIYLLVPADLPETVM